MSRKRLIFRQFPVTQKWIIDGNAHKQYIEIHRGHEINGDSVT